MVHCSGSGIVCINYMHINCTGAMYLDFHAAPSGHGVYRSVQAHILHLILCHPPSRHPGTLSHRNIKISEFHFPMRRFAACLMKNTCTQTVGLRMRSEKRCKLVFSFQKVIRLFQTKWFGVSLCAFRGGAVVYLASGHMRELVSHPQTHGKRVPQK